MSILEKGAHFYFLTIPGQCYQYFCLALMDPILIVIASTFTPKPVEDILSGIMQVS
jgi:hypothetical protein